MWPGDGATGPVDGDSGQQGSKGQGQTPAAVPRGRETAVELGGEETERARRWQQSRGGLPCTPCCSSPQLPTPRPNAGAGCVSPPGPRTAAPTEGKGARGPWGKEPEGPAETTTACRSRRPGPRARAGWAVTNVTGRKWEPELGTAPPGRTTRTRAAVAFGCHWAPARAAFPGPSRGLPDVGEARAAPSPGSAEGSAPGRRCRPVKSCPPRPGSSKSRWHREVPQQSAKAADPAVGREAEAQAAAAGTCQGRLATRAPSPGAGEPVVCLGQPAANTWHPQVTYQPQNRPLMKQTSRLPPAWGPRPPVTGSVSLGWRSPPQGVRPKESCPLGPLPAGSCLRSHILDFMQT